MAFMMPVVKNEWDIYKSNRSRKTSECSATRPGNACRSRKVSECRSEGPSSSSYSTSPSDFTTTPRHNSVPDKMSSRQYTRSNSRNSSNSLQIQSPTKSSTSSSPPKNESSTSLNKFHTRLLDKLKKTMKSGKDNERTSS